MNLILFVFSVIGMTNIVVDSTIFAPVRNWTKIKYPKIGELMTCHQCSGFWCGLICGWILQSNNILVIFACGCAGSFLATTNLILSDLLISKTEYVLNNEEKDAK